ncbi:MFS family permease [Sphingobium wenxiniae]|uniref:MFS transporter n=2 Tax=Sphingobium TaxID=165695 RepID=T0GKV5_9SPHN|nr:MULTISPECIES: MFS transporter [Sphingobium]EQB04441.1 MFS transporter [Sphingobium baderi LL03]KMS62908.1 MFS transporter [Sphingobium baderi LL03]MBB6189830.1 MFS family permease [Sphingobium wenxiniae]TWH97847.1 MFS transporter [Sphingobium wenxiniae]WRD76955.1 MFS transporter [Sphingobium baderi]
MQASLRLLNKRRFLPLFVTQLLGAFNDNLFKNAMVLFVVYQVYNDERSETWFSALATGIFILPFFLLSALSGQLADQRDKAGIIRIIKAAEIAIMAVGAAGLAFIWSGIAVHMLAIPLLLTALFAMGVHSTFFGPIKYAILPQHLHDEEVLGGTGLVEAGTYIAILAGTILAGIIPIEAAAIGIILTALIGYMAGRAVPPAPSLLETQPIDFHVIRSSVTLVRGTMHIRRLFLAIMSISLFWAVGSILFIQFPPLVKNVLSADKPVASLFLAIFSIGIAIGSIAINRLLRGEVSARFAPASVIGMGLCIVAFHIVCDLWTSGPEGELLTLSGFLAHPLAIALSLCLLGVATFGGMFVVPLYAFLTTTVEKCEAARTVAANNIVNSGAMVVGSLLAIGLSFAGVTVINQLLLVALLSLPCAWLAWKLHKACDGIPCH